MSDIKKQFDDRIRQLNEDAGRGRGPQVWKGAKAGLDNFARSLSMDYMNRSTPNITGKEVPYNFNNYYSLDIRVKSDKLSKAWRSGGDEYKKIFRTLYSEGGYGYLLLERLRMEYEAFYMSKEAEASDKSKPIDPNIVPLHTMGNYWSSLDMALSVPIIKNRYDAMPVISIFSSPEKNIPESLAIKEDEFVAMIMNGLESASKGHVPQGVTIEEILEGKFSRKAIAPEHGTFINRVKDPTSDKAFDFRSWDTAVLQDLHNLIMDTFKRNTKLKLTIPELRQSLALDMTRSDLFLYMTQEDFNKFEKGGQGFKNLAKGALDYMQAKAPKLNI